MSEALKEAKRRQRRISYVNRFTQYQQDPVTFATEVLQEEFTDDIVQVMESVRDNPVTIARSANGVGKTHAAARVAVWFYKSFPQAQVYTTAAPPLSNLKRLLWGEIYSLATTHRSMFHDDTVTNLHIERNKKSFITGVAIPTSGTPEERQAKFSGKHAPQLLFIVDEGDAVPKEVYKGIESCMSGGLARLLIIFNPRMEAGPVYHKERSGGGKVIELSAFKHPNVITGENIFPGAVDRTITVRRIHEWTRPLGASEPIDDECFEIPRFLEGAVTRGDDGTPYPPLELGWRKIKEASFYHMVLGVYPAQAESQLISRAWIEAARIRYDQYIERHGFVIPEGIESRMGLDIAEFGTDENVATIRSGPLVHPAETSRGMDPIAAATWAIGVAAGKNISEILVDGTGIGAGVAPYIYKHGKDKKVKAVSIKVAEKPQAGQKADIGEFYQLRDQLWWEVREWLRTDPNAMLPPDQLLLEELRVPTYAPMPTNAKIKVMKKDVMRDLLGRSPDRADSLCLTFAPRHKAKVRRVNNAR